MATWRQRGDPVRLLGKRVLLVVLFALVVGGSLGVWRTYQKERESLALDTQARARAADLAEREGKLKKDIDLLQTDRGREEALREQYAFAAAGEGVVIIVDQPGAPVPSASSSAFVEWLHRTFPWW